MGLAICRRIVERHHGQLTARSRPGEGATFIVQLPLTQPPDAVPPSSSTAHA
ncbi:ATP-binding protein [Rhodothermus marinus]|uniref:ATP-binding protein n=1 Tax=Rhodothermus marinus TaxID=29549 RepID=UPI0034E1A667